MWFSVHYRGHRIDVTVNQDYMEISSRPNTVGPVTVSVRRIRRPLSAKNTFRPH
jgi:hypothetical protein